MKKDESTVKLLKLLEATVLLISVTTCIFILYLSHDEGKFNRTLTYLFVLLIIVVVIICIDYMRKIRIRVEDHIRIKNLILNRANKDLKVPISSIKSMTQEEVLDLTNPRELKESLKDIGMISTYMDTVIEDIITASSLVNTQLHYSPSIIHDVVNQVLEMIDIILERKDITLEVEYKNIDPYRYISIDPQRFQQILMNLLSNALKYTKDKVQLIIEGEDFKTHILLTIHVINNGEAIQQKEIDRFKNFNLMDIEHYNGHGIGICVVNTILKLFDGTLDIVSKPQHTEFIVSFKADYPKEENIRDYSPIQNKNILVLEHDETNIRILEKLLQSQHITIDATSSTSQGYRMFTHSMPQTYDAILLDLRMRDMKSIKIIDRIRSSNHPDSQTIPIITMSKELYNQEETIIQQLQVKHIHKPFVKDELLGELMNVMDHSS